MQPFEFIFLRISGATILFWIAGLFIKKQKNVSKDYLIFFVAAFFGAGLNTLTFFKGLEFISPIHALVIMTTVPIVVFVLSLLILKEKSYQNCQNFESSISQIWETISNAHKTSKETEINRVKEEMTLLKNVIQSFN